MADRIYELEKALKDSHTTIHNIVNNTTNNVQNINVVITGDKINAFGHESYDHISDDQRKSCLKQLTEGIYKLCREIYTTPENQNVRLHKTKAIVANTCTFGQECYMNEEYGLQKWDEENADGGMYYIRHALVNCANPHKQEYHQFRHAIVANLRDINDKLVVAKNASAQTT